MAQSVIDLDAVRSFLSARESLRQQELDRRFEHASQDAALIIGQIASRFDVTRIWQWGSLLDRRRFSEHSDIDVALEGVPTPKDFFAILGIAMEKTDFPVDVVELERVDASVAERIRRTGRLVYERTCR